MIIAETDAYDDLWAQLSALGQQGLRAWRASQGDPTGGLVDGAIRCSFSVCEGIVKPAYVFELDGVRTGLCPQKPLHGVLARRDPAMALELQRLEAANRSAWLEGSQGNTRTDLLNEGGIACSVPGCRGIVRVDYIIITNEGEEGICGLAAEHARLISEDPEARREFERLLGLGLVGPRSLPHTAQVDRHAATSEDLDDLPF